MLRIAPQDEVDAKLRLASQEKAVVCIGRNAHRAWLQASATFFRRGGASAISGSAQRRTAARSLSRVRYSTGDLPSTLARNKAGSRAAARASRPSALSQS